MLYRWREPNSVLMMTDLSNAYLGEDLFLIGGHPNLRDANLEALRGSTVLTMAMNNVPYIYPTPTFWITADRPGCYSSSFFHRPDIIKFTRMDNSLEKTRDSDRVLRTLPSLYFYELNSEKYDVNNILTEGTDFAWWKSVFPVSLQMAWRLGFRRVFLVGCAFWTSKKKSYAWPAELTEAEKTQNQLLYNSDVTRLSAMQPHFDKMGFKVYSCTPDSQANEFLEFIELDAAISEVVSYQPKNTHISQLHHSSLT